MPFVAERFSIYLKTKLSISHCKRFYPMLAFMVKYHFANVDYCISECTYSKFEFSIHSLIRNKFETHCVQRIGTIHDPF